MATPYSSIYNSFLDKIIDYSFLQFTVEDMDNTLYGYLSRSCSKFKRICSIDLSDRNEVTKEFNKTLDDEMVDIIVAGMVLEWITPQYLNNENLKNVLNTKDFSSYSNAELVRQIKEAYSTLKGEFKAMMNQYSYIHGNVSQLSNGN